MLALNGVPARMRISTKSNTNTEELLHMVPFKSFQFCLVYIIENNRGFTGLRCPAWASTATGSSRRDISARMFNKVYLTPELWNDVCGVICFILLLLAILKTTLWLSITCQLTLLSLNKMAAVSQTTFFFVFFKCTFLNKKCGIFIFEFHQSS